MKDFLRWHEMKRKIETSHRPVYFREREMWWCSIGENIGAEQDGKHESFERPVYILRKFNRDLFWGLPLTSTQKDSPFYFPITVRGVLRSMMLSQIKMMSAKRFTRRIIKLPMAIHEKVVQGFLALLNETNPLRGPRVPVGNL